MEAVAALRAALVDSPALDVAGQMALDEALLDSPPAPFVLRFFRWASRPAATFGYFQKQAFVRATLVSLGEPWKSLVARTGTRDEGRGTREGDIPSTALVRRLTGGGIVLHDADVTFSVVLADARGSTPRAIYKDLHRGVHVGLKAAGLETALWSPKGWQNDRDQGLGTRDQGRRQSNPHPSSLIPRP